MVRNAIVVGGGIGGLTAATALAQRGVAVTLTEQAPEITEVGAGLQISPNGLAVLRALGLEQALDRRGAVQAEAVVLEDFRKGRQVARLDLRRLQGQRYLFVHRADLVAVLVRAAQEANVSIELGRRAVAVVPAPLSEVRYEDGSAARAELVVCADGLHSVGRESITGPTTAQFTGQVAWRALVPNPEKEPIAKVTMGPGRHVVRYPLRGGDMTNIVAVQEREAWAEEGWHQSDDPANLRAAFADFGDPVRALLAAVEEVKLWGLFRHPVAETWVKHSAALLGDAAHPTLPFMAQGANLALEDAWVLARVAVTGDDLSRYQVLRRARAARVVSAASGNAWKYHLRPGPVRWAAHRALSMGSRLAPGVMMSQFDWIYRHDVTD
ncbi:FAD-dependent monooxygenase [Roseobacter weihaiensis]|uniref:FAD-dependent monooxygenase n=1 Tax=Roseobacter weihaiensis TaxID=2763262 RepID=UPI001D0B5386|nr:FAD-dependent monooxygenase [Roseobacter sp. H9]